MILTREELIQNIKEIGQSLIDNAEEIVGAHKYRRDLVITCYPSESEEAPYISVDSSFIPENLINRMMSRGE